MTDPLSNVLHGYAQLSCSPEDPLPPKTTVCVRSTSRSPPPPPKKTKVIVTLSDEILKYTDDCPEEPLSLGLIQGFGYYPFVKVGSRLGTNDRYEIVSKLGWGGGATVWLAIDMQQESKTFVAIKILTVTVTDLHEDDMSWELQALQKISSANPNHPGFQHSLALRDHFVISGPMGNHICLVTDVLGSSLKTLRSPDKDAFPLHVAKQIIKQVLQALSYLHDECGYVHVEVHPENVLVKLPQKSDPQIDAYLQANPSITYDREFVHEPDLPPDAVFTISQPLPNFGLDPSLDNISVCLIDYEEVLSFTGRFPNIEYQPPIYRAPEIILWHSLHTPIDVWSIGCLLFELVTNVPLFGLSGTFTVDSQLQTMAELFGPFPHEFVTDCKHRSEFFDEQGNLLRTRKMEPVTLEDVLRRLNVNEEDVPGMAGFVRRCMVLDPARRPSALELLQDPWLESDV